MFMSCSLHSPWTVQRQIGVPEMHSSQDNSSATSENIRHPRENIEESSESQVKPTQEYIWEQEFWQSSGVAMSIYVAIMFD